MQVSTQAPWADTMESIGEEGHGGGEGAPPGSDTWSTWDWDRYDLNTLIHAHIMVHYEMIAYTRIAERVVRNRAAHDAVIDLLCTSLDNLIALRDTVTEGTIF